MFYTMDDFIWVQDSHIYQLLDSRSSGFYLDLVVNKFQIDNDFYLI